MFFRHSTKNKAKSAGVTGWVRNLGDGRVEAVFEGDEQAVREVVRWCRKGPEGAAVEDVEVDWKEPFEGFDDFAVRY